MFSNDFAYDKLYKELVLPKRRVGLIVSVENKRQIMSLLRRDLALESSRPLETPIEVFNCPNDSFLTIYTMSSKPNDMLNSLT